MLFNARNLFFIGLGAAIAYFFDPVTGAARREAMTRRAKSVYEEGAVKVRAA